MFTVEQLRRLARTRETIERRFEAPAVERPAEAQPKDQPKDEAAPLSSEELAAWFAPPVDGVDTKREEINGAASYRDRDEGLHWQIRNMGRTRLFTPDEEKALSAKGPAISEVGGATSELDRVVGPGAIGAGVGRGLQDRAGGRISRFLREARRACQRAKATMINANLRLVVSISKRYQHRGLHFQDVIKGTFGLNAGRREV